MATQRTVRTWMAVDAVLVTVLLVLLVVRLVSGGGSPGEAGPTPSPTVQVQGPTASSSQPVSFRLPSGNIACTMSTAVPRANQPPNGLHRRRSVCGVHVVDPVDGTFEAVSAVDNRDAPACPCRSRGPPTDEINQGFPEHVRVERLRNPTERDAGRAQQIACHAMGDEFHPAP